MILKRALLCLVLLPALAAPCWLFESAGAASAEEGRAAAFEHELSLLVELPPRGPKEDQEAYRARRVSIYEEALTRLLRRYRTFGVRDLTGRVDGSAKRIVLTMRARSSRATLESVALGRGALSIRALLNQDELWAQMSEGGEASGALPAGVEIVDTFTEEGLALRSEDASVLQAFIARLITGQERQLALVRDEERGFWRTVWLGEEQLSGEDFKEVTRGRSAMTAATYGELHLSEEAIARWDVLKKESESALALTLDGEPVMVLHRPDSAALKTGAASEPESSLTFQCRRQWAPRGGEEACTALVAARASAPIPLKIALETR